MIRLGLVLLALLGLVDVGNPLNIVRVLRYGSPYSQFKGKLSAIREVDSAFTRLPRNMCPNDFTFVSGERLDFKQELEVSDFLRKVCRQCIICV